MAFDLPVEFRRIYSGPIESTEQFTSSTDLNNYLTNPARYAGQLVTLIENGEVYLYLLDANKDNWVGVKTTSDVITVNAKTGVVVLDADDIDDTNTVHKFVTATQISEFHTHSNKSILDNTEESFTTDLKNMIEGDLTVIDGGTF